MALLIVVEGDGASDSEVAAYGRRVLARDREIDAAVAEPRQARGGRTVMEPTAHGDRLVMAIAVAALVFAVAVAVLLLLR
jgi:hypothetical protein